jgi:hypothetical protein
MNCRITLIHGTGAKNAKWICQNSKFATRLKDKLGRGFSSIITEEFRWSGWNSHKARLNESKRLASKLSLDFQRFPDEKHVLIGHSHGGNVILYALQQINNIPKDLIIVALATPFFNSKRRENKFSLSLFLLILRIVFFSMFAIGTIWLLHLSDNYIFPIYDYLNQYSTESTICLIVFFIGIIYSAKRLSARIVELTDLFLSGLEAKSEQFIKDTDSSRISHLPISSFIFEGDEAKAHLTIFQTIAETPFFLTGGIEIVRKFFSKNLQTILGSIVIIGWGLGMFGFIDYNQGLKIFMISGYTIAIALAIGAAYLGISIIINLLLSGIKSNPLVFGFESLDLILFIRTFVSQKPDKMVNHILNKYPRKSAMTGQSFLRHSRIYESEEIIDDVAKYVREYHKL